MAKLYKVEMYILDINETYEDICDICDDATYDMDLVKFEPINTQIRKIEWSDNIDLNKNTCTIETYRKYFE